MKFLQAITFATYLCLAICCGVVVYKVHEQIEKVERWVEAIDATLAKHAVIIQKQGDAVHRLIDRIRPGEPGDAPRDSPEAPPVNPDTANSDIFVPGKPTVLLYSLNGCEPCERWLREQAPRWVASGWAVKRKLSTSKRPTPYWLVYDGTRFMEFDTVLTPEVYRAAGGK